MGRQTSLATRPGGARPQAVSRASVRAQPTAATTRPTVGGRADAILSLQRSAGNGAVTAALKVQRDMLMGPRHLEADRFQGDDKLERTFEDEDRVRPGDKGRSVATLQQAFVDLGRGYDLGTGGTAGNGVDGSYGQKTSAAVMRFKAEESLGSTQLPDVGPGTMGRLDQLFQGSGKKDPPPVDTEGVVDPAVGEDDGAPPPAPSEVHAPPPQVTPEIEYGARFRRPTPRSPFEAMRAFRARPGTTEGFGEQEIGPQTDGPVDRSGEARAKEHCTGGGLGALFGRLWTAIDQVIGLAAKVAATVVRTAAITVGSLFGPIGSLIGGIAGYFASNAVASWLKDKAHMLLDPLKAHLMSGIQHMNTLIMRPLTPIFDLQAHWEGWMRSMDPWISWSADAVTWLRNTLAKLHLPNGLVGEVAQTLNDFRRYGDKPADQVVGCRD